MMHLHEVGEIQVLSFDTTEEARSVGEHLAAMADGCLYYAIGDEVTPRQLEDALKYAREARA